MKQVGSDQNGNPVFEHGGRYWRANPRRCPTRTEITKGVYKVCGRPVEREGTCHFHPPRRPCSSCGSSVPLRANGTLRQHFVAARLNGNPGVRAQVRCPGSWRNP